MKNYSKKYLPLIIGAACAVGIIMGSFLNFSNPNEQLLSSHNNEKIERLLNYIQYDYVDKVNTDSIVDVAINNILKNLDPHSTYIPKSHYKEVSEEMDGDFVGIGVQFFMRKDTVTVIRTINDSPSEEAGLKPGDRLLYANNTPLYGAGMTLDSLKGLLRGELNSTVHLKVKRHDQLDLLDIAVVRKHIPLKSVDAAFMLNNRLGYIKIDRFSKNTYNEFEKALKNLEKQGAQDITLDLRDNGGGYLKEAIEIVDEFLKKGKLVLITKDRKGKTKKTYATSGGDFENANVYVLINQNTASASEILAGALQDNDVGTIVGRRSYGKGLVQREMSLGDGSVVRLTVARYYTPTGRSIQKPYKKGNMERYFRDYLRRYENGELVYKDSIHVNDSLKFTTPKGKVVYGGGGIVPDVFVSKDISYKKESLDYMLSGGVMERFIFEELDKDRSYYNHLSLEDFENDVVINNKMIEKFIAYLEKFNLHFDVDKYRDLLKEYLKATMAKQLFGSNASAQIIVQKDPMVQKVLALEQDCPEL